MFHHLNTNRWDLHINQPRGESCIKHVCCISRMNFYRSDFEHKIYGLYTGKYGSSNYAARVLLLPAFCLQRRLRVLYHNGFVKLQIC